MNIVKIKQQLGIVALDLSRVLGIDGNATDMLRYWNNIDRYEVIIHENLVEKIKNSLAFNRLELVTTERIAQKSGLKYTRHHIIEGVIDPTVYDSVSLERKASSSQDNNSVTRTNPLVSSQELREAIQGTYIKKENVRFGNWVVSPNKDTTQILKTDQFDFIAQGGFLGLELYSDLFSDLGFTRQNDFWLRNYTTAWQKISNSMRISAWVNCYLIEIGSDDVYVEISVVSCLHELQNLWYDITEELLTLSKRPLSF